MTITPPYKITHTEENIYVFETTPGETLPLAALAAFEAFGEAVGMEQMADLSLDMVKFVSMGDVAIVVYAAWVAEAGRRVKCDEGMPFGHIQQLTTKRITNAPRDTVARLVADLQAILVDVMNPEVTP